MTEQRGTSRGLDAKDEALANVPDLCEYLIAGCKKEGFVRFAPPMAYGYPEGEWQEFSDCRVLLAWIPDRAFSDHAG